MRTLAFLLIWNSLLVVASAQNYFVLSRAEGDLNSDGVPERVFVVSPQSPDPTNSRSEKLLLVMEYHQKSYRKAFSMPIKIGFFCKTTMAHLTSAYADYWGLSYLPPAQGQPARMKLVFTPGSGEFCTLVHDGAKYRIEGSGD